MKNIFNIQTCEADNSFSFLLFALSEILIFFESGDYEKVVNNEIMAKKQFYFI